MTLPNTELNSEILASLGAEEIAPVTSPIIEEDIYKEEAEPNTPSNHYSPGISSAVEEKALALLGSGVNSDSVASALGVTPARISQMLAEKSFSQRVSELRYKALQEHNVRDSKYDSLEDKLLHKLDKSLPFLIKPESILKAINIVNNAKRRGQCSPEQVSSTKTVVELILPSIIAAKFSINGANQVMKAGEQELITMPSGNLLKQVEDASAVREGTELIEQE